MMMTTAECAQGRAGRPPDGRFCKMHGAGNDFVVLDLRDSRASPTPAQCRALANRHTGVGCDQILTIEPPRSAQALAAYAVFNADGSPSGQCGNGARCVAAWLWRAGAVRERRFVLDSPSGTHAVEALDNGHYQVSMGQPLFVPERIPLAGFARAQTTYTFVLHDGSEIDAAALSMGNPHALIEVASCADAPLARWGQALQASAYFPESVNVGCAEVMDSRQIRLRVFERGVGETMACGSGACAAVVALIRRGRIAREVNVHMPGGTVEIAWSDDKAEVIMRGPTVFVFEGEWCHE